MNQLDQLMLPRATARARNHVTMLIRRLTRVVLTRPMHEDGTHWRWWGRSKRRDRIYEYIIYIGSPSPREHPFMRLPLHLIICSFGSLSFINV